MKVREGMVQVMLLRSSFRFEYRETDQLPAQHDFPSSEAAVIV